MPKRQLPENQKSPRQNSCPVTRSQSRRAVAQSKATAIHRQLGQKDVQKELLAKIIFAFTRQLERDFSQRAIAFHIQPGNEQKTLKDFQKTPEAADSLLQRWDRETNLFGDQFPISKDGSCRREWENAVQQVIGDQKEEEKCSIDKVVFLDLQFTVQIRGSSSLLQEKFQSS
jgi:hypothetical protein